MKSPVSRIAIFALGLVVAIAGLVTTLFMFDYLRYPGLVRRAGSLEAGMTEREVINVMGRPTARILHGVRFNSDGERIAPRKEMWIYGRAYTFTHAFTPDPPYFFPFRLRFAPYSDDISLWVDLDTGTVTEINLPEIAN